MIKNIAFILLFFSSLYISGQQLVWSSFQKYSGGYSSINVIGETSEGILTVRYKDKNLKKGVYVDFFDFGMRLKNSVGISEKKQQLDKVLLFNDRLYGVFNSNSHRALELSIKQLNYKAKEKTELKPWHSIPYHNFKISNFDILYNHSRNAGAFSFMKAFSNSSQLVNTYFDEQTQVEETVNYEFSESIKNINLFQRIIDKNGNLYFVLSTYGGGFFSKDNERYFLLSYNRKDGEWSKQSLNAEETFVSTVYLKEDLENERIILAYFYSLRYKNGNYGLVTASYDSKTQKEIYSNSQVVDKDFARQVTGAKIGKETELNSFKIREVIPTKDSGMVVVAERFFVSDQNETFYQNGMPITSSRNVYNFEEVLFFSLNKVGSIRWNKLVLKRQNSVNDGGYYSSVVIVPAVDKIHLIYNEKVMYNGDVIQYSIDKNGETSQKNIFRNDMASYMIVPVESKQIGYNRAALPIFMSNGDRGLLKLIYKN